MPADRWEAIPERFPLLTAGDLLLREVEPTDVLAWFRRLSDPQVALPVGAEVMQRIEEAEAAIVSIRTLFHEKRMLRWAIVPAGETDAIGSTGFNTFYAHDRRAEIGYGLERAWCGRGIMTAATQAAVGYGFGVLGLHRIEAYVRTDNARSVRVLEHCGFLREGMLQDYHLEQGGWADFWVYGLLRR